MRDKAASRQVITPRARGDLFPSPGRFINAPAGRARVSRGRSGAFKSTERLFPPLCRHCGQHNCPPVQKCVQGSKGFSRRAPWSRFRIIPALSAQLCRPWPKKDASQQFLQHKELKRGGGRLLTSANPIT